MAKNSKKTKFYSNLYVKRRLIKLEVDIFGIISNGLLQHTPKLKVLSQIKTLIRSIAVQIGLDPAEANQVWIKATQDYNRISKQTFAQMRKVNWNEDQRREAIYSSIRAKILDNDPIRDANQVMYSYEYRMKHNEIYGVGGLLDSSSSPFFLASSHPKPAKDHAEWEGKMYYDANWEEKFGSSYSDQEKDAIRAYIRNHQIRTVQWVLGAPVYLVTRRNCKHYLKPIPLQEVLHSSCRALLRDHSMYMPDEKPVSEQVLNYRKYYNRLKIEEMLYEVVPNQKLAQDIKKDKKILDKWK